MFRWILFSNSFNRNTRNNGACMVTLGLAGCLCYMSSESADSHDSDVLREKNRILGKFMKNKFYALVLTHVELNVVDRYLPRVS